MKFMENFDPERSNRKRRKLTRKISNGGKKQQSQLYDERGLLNNEDLCDCLDASCVGCYFPCSKCRSCKCGPECRVNRKWAFEKIEIEGTEKVVFPTEAYEKAMLACARIKQSSSPTPSPTHTPVPSPVLSGDSTNLPQLTFKLE